MNSESVSNIALSNPELAVRKVGSNYHIAFDRTYYSVPYELYGQMVFVRANNSTIHIFNNCGDLVAAHYRSFVKSKYITVPSHMPGFYHSVYDCVHRYDGAMFRKWAQEIGDKTLQIIDSLLASKDFEEHAYKSCMAVLQLTKKFGNSVLEKACANALDSGYHNFYVIRKLAMAEYNRRNNN